MDSEEPIIQSKLNKYSLDLRIKKEEILQNLILLRTVGKLFVRRKLIAYISINHIKIFASKTVETSCIY